MLWTRSKRANAASVLVIVAVESLPDQRVAVERIGVDRFGGGLNR